MKRFPNHQTKHHCPVVGKVTALNAVSVARSLNEKSVLAASSAKMTVSSLANYLRDTMQMQFI